MLEYYCYYRYCVCFNIFNYSQQALTNKQFMKSSRHREVNKTTDSRSRPRTLFSFMPQKGPPSYSKMRTRFDDDVLYAFFVFSYFTM